MLEFKKKIATTKMSEVWEGYYKGQRVAIKKPVKEDMLKLIRFVKEAKYWNEISDLKIDGVARVVAIDENEPWFAVEFIEGETLDKNLRNADIREIMFRMLEVLRVLYIVHNKGYLHLDLKPSNILVDKYGDIVFLDWGLPVRIFRKLKDERYTFIGTPSYAPPELWDPDKYGIPDARSDVYEVGTTFYRVISKQVPFIRKSEVLNGDIRPFPKNVPEYVRKIILKAINPKKEKRYSDTMEMYKDVQYWLQRNNMLWRGIHKIKFKKVLQVNANHGLSFISDPPDLKKSKINRVPFGFITDQGKEKNMLLRIEEKNIKAYKDGVFVKHGIKKKVYPNTASEVYQGTTIYYKKEEIGKLEFGYRNVVYGDFVSLNAEVGRKYFEFINFLKENGIKVKMKRGGDKINIIAHKVLIKGEVPDDELDAVIKIDGRRFHFRLVKVAPLDSDIQIYDSSKDNMEILKDFLRCEI